MIESALRKVIKGIFSDWGNDFVFEIVDASDYGFGVFECSVYYIHADMCQYSFFIRVKGGVEEIESTEDCWEPLTEGSVFRHMWFSEVL